MAQGDGTSADVPGRYDVVIGGKGYMLLQSLEPSLPFRTHRAVYSHSPTFIERQNVGNAYGDNSQDFFLTVSQLDFSLGEAQRFYRSDADRSRRYWYGTAVDALSIPGTVTLRNTAPSLAFSEAVTAVAELNTGTAGVYTVGAASLAFVAATGAITNKGAHGLGAAPSQWGLTTDSSNAYISTTTAGTVGVRKYSGSAFSTFSATGADSLAFLDNTLFGFNESAGTLIQYDTAGAATTLFTWKAGDGTALTGSAYGTRLRADGGKLVMLRKQGVRGRGELWQYDGGVSQLAEFKANFSAQDMEIVDGVVFATGYLSRNADYLPAVFYYVNGNTGLLWNANVAGYTNTTWPALAAYGDGCAFTDDTTGKLMLYNIASGGVHTLGSYTASNATPMMAGSRDVLLHTRAAATAYYFPSTSVVSSGTVATSLVDFDNSLTKSFRGIKLDFDAPAGSTVDLEYQIDSVTGSWTTLKTGATSGTEYPTDGSAIGTGHAIAARVTLNKGSSSAGPTLKRVYFRAAPRLQTYRRREYVLDLSGIGLRDDTVKLADGTFHSLSGHEQADNLITSITSGTPVAVSDRFVNQQTSLNGSTTVASFNAFCEPDQCEIYEVDEGWDNPQFPGGFVAKVTLREV